MIIRNATPILKNISKIEKLIERLRVKENRYLKLKKEVEVKKK